MTAQSRIAIFSTVLYVIHGGNQLMDQDQQNAHQPESEQPKSTANPKAASKEESALQVNANINPYISIRKDKTQKKSGKKIG